MSGRVWRFQHELADACRLVAPDLRGHGRSSTPVSGYSLDYLAGDIIRMFEVLDLSKAVLLGWSLGSQIALAAFPAIKERLVGLVLVGGTPRFTATDGYPFGLPANEPRGMGLRLKRDFNKTMGEFFRAMFAEGELSRVQENLIAREIIIGGRLPEPGAAMQVLEVLSSADLRAVLPRIDLPVQLIHGSHDSICPLAGASFMAEQLPNARLTILEGLGHAPFLSHPAKFNAILRDFLQDVYDRN
jgi:pimeloyl-[acyl-carrier protein] methyl ester esterase